MPHATLLQLDLIEEIDDRFDRWIEWLLIATLALAPAAMGAVAAWSEAIFCAMAFAAAMLLALKLIRRRDQRFVRSYLYWPIALFAGLVAVQMIPLPADVIRVISPATLATKLHLLGDGDPSFRLPSLTLTFYAEASWHDIRLLAATVCLFVVTLNVFRSRDRIRRLLAAIAIIGGVFALLSLAQIVTGTTRIYWMFPDPSGYAVRSGPFVNHSHFGQWMNLSIGAAAGLLLETLNRIFRRNDYSPDEIGDKLRSRSMRPAWLLMAMIVLSTSAVVLSLSRGAMLGLASGGAVAGVLLICRRGMAGKMWIVGGVSIAVLAVIAFDASSLIHRIGGASAQQMQGNRVQILRDLVPAWKMFPIVGTGLGTHGVIFPMFDRSAVALQATHAENEYAQLLTETGAIGLACAVAFVAMISIAAISAYRGHGRGSSTGASHRASPASAMAIGLVFGWVAILVHSFTDFAQHLPAVAALTAVTSALLVNLASLRRAERGQLAASAESPLSIDLPRAARTARRSFALRVASLVIVTFGAAMFLNQAYQCSQAEADWEVVKRIESPLQKDDWLADNAEYYDLIEAAAAASRARPGDAMARYWLNVYRWKALARSRDAKGAVALRPDVIPSVHRIIDELLIARQDCPTFGPINLLAGQLERAYWPERTARARTHLKLAVELSGPDASAAIALGESLARDGEIVEAGALLRRAVELNPANATEAANIFLEILNRPALAVEAAGRDADALDALAARLEARPADAALASQAREQALAIRRQRADADDANINDLSAMATICMRSHDEPAAIRYLQRALSLDFTRNDLRLQLARAYLGLRDLAAAKREVDSVLHREPRNAEAVNLSVEIDRAAAATPR